MLQEEETLTPLQQPMASFGKKLSVLVLFLCVLFFVAGWFRGEDIIKMELTSISLSVAAIPEVLPAVTTISLALAAKRMIRFNSLIKKLPAVETLGSVTYICTDKTGTRKQRTFKLVMNNLNAHFEESLLEIFRELKTKELMKKLRFIYTPKHAYV